VQQISLFARHFSKSPEILGPEEIRSYQLYLTNEKKLAPSSILIAIAALRFLYKVTLHKDWSLEEIIPAPKKPQKLPIVLSPEEVLQFLSCVQSVKHRTILTVCYAAGLRISEAVHLKVADIDSERMVMLGHSQEQQIRPGKMILRPKRRQTLQNRLPWHKQLSAPLRSLAVKSTRLRLLKRNDYLWNWGSAWSRAVSCHLPLEGGCPPR